MDSDKLYRVKKEDIPKLEKLLTVCFAQDPLYSHLIPDEDTRKRLLPELFHCDLEEMFATCEIFADSQELNGVLVVSDESEPYNFFQYYATELHAYLKTDEYLIKEDPSLKTFWNCKRAGLFKFPLDRSASSGRAASHYLSGCKSGHAASWDFRPSDERGHRVCP